MRRKTLHCKYHADTSWVGAALDQLQAAIDEVLDDGTQEHAEMIAVIRSLDVERIRAMHDDDMQSMAILAIAGLMAAAQRIEKKRGESVDWVDRI